MTPQDFSDDVCRCARCSGDGRGVGARMSLANQALTGVEKAKRAHRAAVNAIYPRRSAVQPEERGRAKP